MEGMCFDWIIGGGPGRVLPVVIVRVQRSFSCPRAEKCCLPIWSPAPVVARAQMENEYGFCGNDKVYLRHLVATARK